MRPGRADPCLRVERQHGFILFLHEHGIPVAPPLRTADGGTFLRIGGNPYSLYPYVHGPTLDPSNLRQMEAAGRTFARYHRVATGYRGPDPLDEEPFPRLWARRRQEYAMRVEALGASAGELGMDEALGALERLLPALESAVVGLPYADLPRTLIHGDFVPWNILCRGDDVAAVLDFGRSRREARVYDLVITTVQLLRKEPVERFQGSLRAFLAGYGAVQTLEERELHVLPTLLSAALAVKAFKRLRRLAPTDRGLVRRREKARDFCETVRRLERSWPNAAAVEASFRSGLRPDPRGTPPAAFHLRGASASRLRR